MISIVAAMDEKRGIGKDNDLLFKIPEDFTRMKVLTTGHPLIMGRKTYDSIGHPLPNRTNIVVSRNPFEIQNKDGIVIVGSLDEAIEFAGSSPGSEEIIIFGGGQIFKEAIEKDLVDILHLTVVKGDFGADTFFPDYSKFRKVKEEKRTDWNFPYSFITLER
jgi:dihydrofolate reductase